MNQFTINLYGELASSIEFVYTDSWLTVYSIVRVSSNRLITDEISLLDFSKVVFYMDDYLVIDESDSMFGAGNNGRDCIQQSDRYEYNLLNCFFQNHSPSYFPNIYLSGTITTSGISRYNDKFDFSLSLNQDITFSLTPKRDVDFSYYIQTDGYVCPKLLHQITKTSGCEITLFYADPIKFVALSSPSHQLITTRFQSNSTMDFMLGIGTWSVKVEAKECFILDCRYTIEFNVVQVTTPNVEIIPAADKLLVAKVYYSSEQTLASTVSDMEAVIRRVDEANLKIENITKQLNELNFDMVELYPYENFTEMRKDVLELIENIPIHTEPEETENCDGPWSSVGCWFEDFLSALIGIAIFVVLIVVGYCVCVKLGVADKLFGKSESDEADYVAEYRAD
jgi:hypothetical protein